MHYLLSLTYKITKIQKHCAQRSHSAFLVVPLVFILQVPGRVIQKSSEDAEKKRQANFYQRKRSVAQTEQNTGGYRLPRPEQGHASSRVTRVELRVHLRDQAPAQADA